MKKRIANFGAFDHDSYGDLLFPFISKHYLSDEFEVINVSPTGGKTPWIDALPSISVNEAIQISEWDGVLIGGGDIAQAAEWIPEKYQNDKYLSFGGLTSLWIGASILAIKLNIPIAWNAPGFPANPLPFFLPSKDIAIKAADYLNVRDEHSKNLLSDYTDKNISIISDTAITLKKLWGNSVKSEDIVISVSVSDFLSQKDDISNGLKTLKKDSDIFGNIQYLPLMEWQWSNESSTDFIKTNFNDVLAWENPMSIKDCAQTISSSRGYIGNSLHGYITAVSYGLPAILVIPSNATKAHKYKGFIRSIGQDENYYLASNWIQAFELFKKLQGVFSLDEVFKSQKLHWNKVKNLFNNNPLNKQHLLKSVSNILIDDSFEIAQFGIFPKGLADYRFSLHQKRLSDENLINDLRNESSNLVSQYELSLNKLNNELSENKKQIVKLTDHYESNLNQLNSELSDNKRLIIKLNENVNELSQHLSDRNQEIFNLNQLINKYTKNISDLNKQIVGLNDEIFQRGEWGLGLDEELKQTQEKLREEQERFNLAITSNSWRITKPLREIRFWASSPKTQTKRYTKKSLNLIKNFYQSRSYDLPKIEKHRNFLAKYAPKLLSFTQTRFDGREKSPTSLEEIENSLGNIPLVPKSNNILEILASPIEKAENIELNTSDVPVVSVIIPIYGKITYTLNCLASIAKCSPRIPFEIIVVDDNSPDESKKILTEVKGIRLIENSENQGFIRSCNIGASVAKGEYLHFLNNDTQVTDGWMDELFRTFHELPETGLAGSKLIYPDGKLQEAGGIIWQDGSAWNFGRYQDPRLPIYNYAREVDYCSGASIMVPKSLFDELGGFDEHYLPAYCEDSDLALKIREKGCRVIYQPLSEIIHYEGVSSGTDLSEGTKSYQVENSKKLYERWKDHLSKHQPSGINADDAKDRRATRRVLVLEHCTPTPNQDAGSVTVYNLLVLLREMDFQVTFIPEDNFLYMPEYTTALQRIGVEVLYAPYTTSVEEHLTEYGERYDLAFLFRPTVVERNIKDVRKYCPKAKVLFYTHDLHFVRMSREAELFNDKVKQQLADEMKIRELEAVKSVDATILVSDQELEVIKEELPEYTDRLHTLPLILDIPGTDKGFSDRRDIVFVGGFQHTPNIDAVLYFVYEIMPLIRQELPDVRFYAVGSNPPEEILNLATDDVIITGFVEDLNSLLDKIRVSVAPLRYGAGVKGKVGTAMAAGLPVVATQIAAEGMVLKNWENICICNSSKDLADTIIKLYNDQKLWNKISKGGLRFAEDSWGNRSISPIFLNILNKLGIKEEATKYPIFFFRRNLQPPKISEKSTNKVTIDNK